MSPPLTADDFEAFLLEVHGHAPFPWQGRLCAEVLASGWPRVLDLPTGVGKTAALDVAVFALAASTDATSRVHPLRIVYVVDRRTIVDQAFSRARQLVHALRAPPPGSARERVAEGLRSWSGLGEEDGDILSATSLRGAVPRSDLWSQRPDRPQVLVSTVDQVGSRLLFRGYGVSDRMRSVHAGLLGNDCLYLLDEVHLSQPFRETLEALATRYRSWSTASLPSRFDVVSMSATVGTCNTVPFRLTDEDRNHPELRRRLEAQKPARLLETDARRLPREVSKAAKAWLSEGCTRIGVVVNRVATARDLAAAVAKDLPRLMSSW
jgi:CRISPR-associated endonuclease/helicase Cas3